MAWFRSLKSTRVLFYFFWLAILAFSVIVSIGNIDRFRPHHGLPYYARFEKGSEDRWTAFGGTWQIAGGSMRNDSDDRGAKLLTGSQYWSDYTVEADVQLLGQGDAGLIARVSDAEIGVDSYTGYYAGIRTMDQSLVIGRVRHGWQELTARQMPGSVQPFRWYHLALTVSGCRVSATASVPETGEHVSDAVTSAVCIGSGRVGLRSYSSGGIWRNVVVRAAGSAPAAAPGKPVTRPANLPSPEGTATQRSILASYVPSGLEDDDNVEMPTPKVQAIESLRFVSPLHPPQAAVRGVVVLKAPVLYVQDATGGVSVEPVSSPSLKIGDEVEVRGSAETQHFSSSLKNARVRLLWEASPGPPLSVTANQAATGAYDAMFIQVEGYLVSKASSANGALLLSLKAGQQTFRALLDRGRSASHIPRLYERSLLRLRGVCVTDARYTGNTTPFLLLVRSSEDVEVIAGPPWWSLSTLIPIGIVVVILSGLAYNLYVLAKHWRLRAVLEERGRLAHDIHDTLAQSFAGIGFQLEAIRNSMPENAPKLEQQVYLACDLVRHSHEEARRSIASLRPETLESADLLPALKSCAERMVQHGAVSVETVSEGSAIPVPPRIKDTLFRIGQEGIANAIRHSNAEHLSIRVRYQRSSVTLLVEDDGCGLVPPNDTFGFGLIGMRKRAESISAVMQLTSAPGKGVRLSVTAPLPARLAFGNWPRHAWRESKSNAEKHNPYSYR